MSFCPNHRVALPEVGKRRRRLTPPPLLPPVGQASPKDAPGVGGIPQTGSIVTIAGVPSQVLTPVVSGTVPVIPIVNLIAQHFLIVLTTVTLIVGGVKLVSALPGSEVPPSQSIPGSIHQSTSVLSSQSASFFSGNIAANQSGQDPQQGLLPNSTSTIPIPVEQSSLVSGIVPLKGSTITVTVAIVPGTPSLLGAPGNTARQVVGTTYGTTQTILKTTKSIVSPVVVTVRTVTGTTTTTLLQTVNTVDNTAKTVVKTVKSTTSQVVTTARSTTQIVVKTVKSTLSKSVGTNVLNSLNTKTVTSVTQSAQSATAKSLKATSKVTKAAQSTVRSTTSTAKQVVHVVSKAQSSTQSGVKKGVQTISAAKHIGL
ncbi:MAG TPA: hypothetical protein VKR06_33010 [Ktedonosporobacter sp.]|nr:hypothetical protein [Ktedonosporobacter sp.]